MRYSSSGTADRYQYVLAGLLCPMYALSAGISASMSFPALIHSRNLRTANE